MTKSNQNEENQVSADSTQPSDGRKQYCAPLLTIRGSVNEITRGAQANIGDREAASV